MKTSVLIFLGFLLLWYLMDSEKVNFFRAILNDVHYWLPALCIFLLLIYMIGRFIYLEKRNKTPETALLTKQKDSTKVVADTVPKMKEDRPIKKQKIKVMEEKPTGNTMKIDSGGSGIQNNAPNKGIQAGRDIIITTEKRLTDEELNFFLSDVKSKSNGLTDVHFSIPFGSNGNNNIMKQLKLLLSNNGYRVMDHVTQVSDPNQYTGNYDIAIRDGKVIEITIRQF